MYREAVFVVVYRIENEKPIYLLLKRHKHWKGWEFPKGGIEKNENKIKTINREILEETGNHPIEIVKHNFSGKYLYDKRLKDRPNVKGQTFSLYSAKINSSKIIFDKREHSDFKWCSFNEAMKLLKWENQKNSMRMIHSKTIEKLSNIKIKKISKKESLEASKLIGECINVAKKLSDRDKEFLKKFYSLENIIRLVHKSKFYVAKINNKIIGTGRLEGSKIAGLYILPEYQKKGIGSVIIQKLESVAKKSNIKKVHLHSLLQSINFYNVMDYKKVRLLLKPVKAYKMEKRLE